MSRQDVVNIVLAVLVPVVTAVVGAIGVAFQDWRVRRSTAGRRKLAVDDARAQVNFVADWWNAKKSLGQSPEALQEAASRATALLEDASAVVSAVRLTSPVPERPVTFRRLALLYPFRTREGRAARAAFFVCSGVTVLALGASVSQQLSDEANKTTYLNGFLIVGGLSAALTLILRFLAVAIEKNAATAAQGGPRRGFTRRMLLFYRFERRPAQVVRAVFYASVVGLVLYVQWNLQNFMMVWLPLNLAGTLVYGATALGMRSWALSLERAAGRPGVPQPAPAAAAVPGQSDHQPRRPAEPPTSPDMNPTAASRTVSQ
jgi:hypothetical protein